MNQADERVIYDGPASQWTNLGRYMRQAALGLIGIAAFAAGRNLGAGVPVGPVASWSGVALFMLACLLALRAWWRVRFLLYRITTERIEIERGLVSKRIENVDLFRVLDIQLQIGLLERLVRVGTIVLQTSDKTTPHINLVGLRDPRRVYETVKRETLRADKRRGVVHLEP